MLERGGSGSGSGNGSGDDWSTYRQEILR